MATVAWAGVLIAASQAHHQKAVAATTTSGQGPQHVRLVTTVSLRSCRFGAAGVRKPAARRVRRAGVVTSVSKRGQAQDQGGQRQQAQGQLRGEGVADLGSQDSAAHRRQSDRA